MGRRTISLGPAGQLQQWEPGLAWTDPWSLLRGGRWTTDQVWPHTTHRVHGTESQKAGNAADQTCPRTQESGRWRHPQGQCLLVFGPGHTDSEQEARASARTADGRTPRCRGTESGKQGRLHLGPTMVQMGWLPAIPQPALTLRTSGGGCVSTRKGQVSR